MKVFSKEKFIEACREAGLLDETQYALNTWVRRIDGQKVVDGKIRIVAYK